MQVIGAIKSALDKLKAPLTNSDYPHVRVPQLNGLLVSLLGIGPGIAFGAYDGADAADVVVGDDEAHDVTDANFRFDPKFVLVYNASDPTVGIHIAGMTDAHMLKLTDAPALTHVSADGITLGERSFTIGEDADLNVNGESGFYFAIGV